MPSLMRHELGSLTQYFSASAPSCASFGESVFQKREVRCHGNASSCADSALSFSILIFPEIVKTPEIFRRFRRRPSPRGAGEKLHRSFCFSACPSAALLHAIIKMILFLSDTLTCRSFARGHLSRQISPSFRTSFTCRSFAREHFSRQIFPSFRTSFTCRSFAREHLSRQIFPSFRTSFTCRSFAY